jgi:hypothetical protein
MMRPLVLLASAALAVASPALRGNTTTHEIVHRHLAALTVRPYQENQLMVLGGPYNGGRAEFSVRSGAKTAGIITSVYLASGGGRTSDSKLGAQDEIDFEWVRVQKLKASPHTH